DGDGTATIAYLKTVRRIASRIAGDHPGSLGLHPAVYFYGETGKYQTTAFLGTVRLIQQFEAKPKQYMEFTRVREQFEDFLLTHRFFATEVVNSYGGGMRRVAAFLSLYNAILGGFLASKTMEEVLREVGQEIGLQFVPAPPEMAAAYGDF